MIRLVYYDIQAGPPRAKIADYLIAQGFVRLQYSVYAGVVTPQLWAKTWRRLQALYLDRCHPDDRIYSHVVERDHFEKMSILGPEIDWKRTLHEVDVWFFDDGSP